MPRTKEFSLPSFGIKRKYSQIDAWRNFLSQNPREEVQVLKHCIGRDGTSDKSLKLCGACMLALGEFAIGVTKKELLNSVPKGMRAGETLDSHIGRILDAILVSDRKVPDFDPDFWSKYIPLAEILALERVCELVDPRDPSLPLIKYDLCDPKKQYVMDGTELRDEEHQKEWQREAKKRSKSKKSKTVPTTPSRESSLSPSYSVKFESPSKRLLNLTSFKRGGRSLDFLSPKKSPRSASTTERVMDRVEILKTFEERLAWLGNPQAKEFTIEVTLSSGEKMTIASHAGFL